MFTRECTTIIARMEHRRFMAENTATPSLDRKRRAKTVLRGSKRKYYPHTGDSKGKRT